MSLKSIPPQILTSRTLRTLSRAIYAARRRLSGKPPVFHAFVEPTEPYSALLVQALPRIANKHGAEVVWHEVGAPERSAAPEPEKLAAWSVEDAGYLAEAYGLDLDAVAWPELGARDAGEVLRARLGHYASGMTWFEGEWYWGIDRLHHLEERLGAADLLFPPVAEPRSGGDGEVEVFFSLRSPYSYIAMMRLPALAERWGARVKLRPVLPMVMRSLPVPRAKRFYIAKDCAREADRFDLPFGKIADPVGAGVERGLAILVREIEAGRGAEFAQAFLTSVWSDGIDAATDKGLFRICQRAGIAWADAKAALADDRWREVVEANREALFEGGHWGVPSYRVGGRMAFGQDRLWLVGRWLGAS